MISATSPPFGTQFALRIVRESATKSWEKISSSSPSWKLFFDRVPKHLDLKTTWNVQTNRFWKYAKLTSCWRNPEPVGQTIRNSSDWNRGVMCNIQDKHNFLHFPVAESWQWDRHDNAHNDRKKGNCTDVASCKWRRQSLLTSRSSSHFLRVQSYLTRPDLHIEGKIVSKSESRCQTPDQILVQTSFGLK